MQSQLKCECDTGWPAAPPEEPAFHNIWSLEVWATFLKTNDKFNEGGLGGLEEYLVLNNEHWTLPPKILLPGLNSCEVVGPARIRQRVKVATDILFLEVLIIFTPRVRIGFPMGRLERGRRRERPPSSMRLKPARLLSTWTSSPMIKVSLSCWWSKASSPAGEKVD